MDPIKKVVSVSLGSSKRDHAVELELFGTPFSIRREGTNGDVDAAIARLRELDGNVDAIGLGVMELFLHSAGRDYYFREGKRFASAVKQTPLVDGSGLKGAVEGDVVRFMSQDLGLELKGKRVLVTSAVDRWGLAMAFADAGCEMTYADLLYALGIPIMIHSKKALVRTVHTLAPLAVQLPLAWLYPGEADHTSEVEQASRHSDLYRQADIIAGDYKYVRRYMPEDMSGKWIVTNTTTAEDVEFLRDRGVELLITSTPRLEGRSFGTNVIEATMIALDGASSALSSERYLELIKATGFTPDAQWLLGQPAVSTQPASEIAVAPAPSSA